MMGVMTKEQRRRYIVRYLRRNSTSSIAELSRELAINRETLRRDLVLLEKDGLVARNDNRIYLNDTPEVRQTISRYGALTREERIHELRALMQQKRKARISRLSQTFQVTPTTLRTDLKQLELEGVVRLGHGSAEYTGDTTVPFLTDSPEPSQAVEMIASRGASHIESGDTVFLDDSSFAREIVQKLQHARDITVVTTSLHVAYVLSKREYPCEIITLSGALKPGGTALRPLETQPYLQGNRVDKAFLGIGALSPRGYYSLEVPIPEETVRQIVTASDKLFIALLSRSVGSGTGPAAALALGAIEDQVTEVMVDDALDKARARALIPASVPVALCGRDYVYYLRRDPGKKIGFSVYPGHTDFRQEVSEGLETACKELGNYTLHTWHNTGDYESIISNVDHLLDEQVDLLIDYSSNYEVAVLVAQRAAELSTPLIMVDMAVPNAVYFGANNVLAGQIAGENAAAYICREWKGSVDMILLLEKEISGSVCKQRLLGSIDALRKRVRFSSKEVKHVDCSRGVDYYAGKLERYLERLGGNDTCLVISFGEDTTVETHDIIARHAEQKPIIMVAQNYGYQLRYLMSSGHSPLVGCVSYAQEQYGERIMELARRLLEGERVEPVNYTEHSWIPNEFHPYYSRAPIMRVP
jgi:DeoR/GlpR family transcriptional regulator of sugar metabolism/DNA-binding LacI/PurR family transcriptional regulator